MPVIFISYRREDSAGHAGRLFDRLREHFGRDRVFLDVVGIEAGVDFVDTIDKAVGSCDVLLAVIGREWLTCCDKQGGRRLDDPNDFIRAEISAALKRNVRVVPVLVEGAGMPPTDELPEELKRLTRRQAVELRDSRWDADIEDLIAALERDATPGAAPPSRVEPIPVEKERKPGRPAALLWGIGALIVAALIATGLFLWLTPKPPVVVPSPEDGQTTAAPEPTQEPPPVDSPPEDGQTTVSPEPQPVDPSPDIVEQPPQPDPEPKTVSTPNLVGLSLEEAREKLRTSGLTAGNQKARQTSDAPARQVLSQLPRAGREIEVNSPVHLVYAEPPPDTRIVVPNVVGTDLETAMATVRGAGLDFTRRSEPSTETKFKVLRQEPAAGSRVEKGTKIALFFAYPPKDEAPAQTTVFIYYADEAARKAAEGLEGYLRGLRFQGTVSFKTMQSNRRMEPGKLFYSSEGQADLAKSIASRSGYHLSKDSGRKVLIEAKLDPRVARTGMVLTLPSPRR